MDLLDQLAQRALQRGAFDPPNVRITAKLCSAVVVCLLLLLLLLTLSMVMDRDGACDSVEACGLEAWVLKRILLWQHGS